MLASPLLVLINILTASPESFLHPSSYSSNRCRLFRVLYTPSKSPYSPNGLLTIHTALRSLEPAEEHLGPWPRDRKERSFPSARDQHPKVCIRGLRYVPPHFLSGRVFLLQVTNTPRNVRHGRAPTHNVLQTDCHSPISNSG